MVDVDLKSIKDRTLRETYDKSKESKNTQIW